METGRASRISRAVPLLLVAATVTGVNSAASAAFTLLGTFFYLQSFEDEVGVPLEDFDLARDFAISEAWTHGAVLFIGLILAIVGTYALRRRHRVEGLTWRHVVAGAVVAAPLTYVLALLIPGALIDFLDLGPMVDQYE
jgi:ABC-type Fe3+-siderophore transport system permease subunit